MNRPTSAIAKIYRRVPVGGVCLFLVVLGLFAWESKTFAAPPKDDLVDPSLRKELLGYLEEINHYILGLDLGSDSLKR